MQYEDFSRFFFDFCPEVGLNVLNQDDPPDTGRSLPRSVFSVIPLGALFLLPFPLKRPDMLVF